MSIGNSPDRVLIKLSGEALMGERSFGKGSVQSLVPLRSQPKETFKDENRNGVHDTWETFDDRNGNGKYDAGPRLKMTRPVTRRSGTPGTHSPEPG